MPKLMDMMTREEFTSFTFNKEQAQKLISYIEVYAQERGLPYSERFMIEQTIRYLENASGTSRIANFEMEGTTNEKI